MAEVVFDMFLHGKVMLLKWLLTFSRYVYMEKIHTFHVYQSITSDRYTYPCNHYPGQDVEHYYQPYKVVLTSLN